MPLDTIAEEFKAAIQDPRFAVPDSIPKDWEPENYLAAVAAATDLMALHRLVSEAAYEALAGWSVIALERLGWADGHQYTDNGYSFVVVDGCLYCRPDALGILTVEEVESALFRETLDDFKEVVSTRPIRAGKPL